MEGQSTITPQTQKARSLASLYGSRVIFHKDGASMSICKRITNSRQIIYDAVSLSEYLLRGHAVDKVAQAKTLESLRDIQKFVLENMDQKYQKDKIIFDSLENLIVALA